MVGVVSEADDPLDITAVLAGCCSGRNADPKLGFNWNATHGFG